MDTQRLENLSEADKWRLIYEIWATEGEQNDYRTAEITGLARTTINYHRTREGWPQRFRDERLGLSNADVDVARIRWKRMLIDGQSRMEHIVYGRVEMRDHMGKVVLDEATGEPVMVWAAEHRDAVSAYRAIMDTVTNRDMGSLDTGFEGGVVAISPGETIDDPALLAAQILEDTQQMVNTRVLSKSGRRKI